jgi:hypothetical protein
VRPFDPISYRFLAGFCRVRSNSTGFALYSAAFVAISRVRRNVCRKISKHNVARLGQSL